jgi:hypothetical protein
MSAGLKLNTSCDGGGDLLVGEADLGGAEGVDADARPGSGWPMA